MRKDLKSAFWSEVCGVVARFFTALRFVLNDDEGGFEDTSSVNCVDTFSFSGDANPFVLRTFPLAGESPQGEGKKRSFANSG